MKQEHFGVIFLNSSKEVIQTKCFYVGWDNRCFVQPKMIFWKACKLEASSMILFHNHPSGNTEPSDFDIELTKNFEKGGKLLGIQVLDHIIIGRYDYYSFLEHDEMSKEENKVKAAEHK
jgi:DNA repair protein RadC